VLGKKGFPTNSKREVEDSGCLAFWFSLFFSFQPRSGGLLAFWEDWCGVLWDSHMFIISVVSLFYTTLAFSGYIVSLSIALFVLLWLCAMLPLSDGQSWSSSLATGRLALVFGSLSVDDRFARLLYSGKIYITARTQRKRGIWRHSPLLPPCCGLK